MDHAENQASKPTALVLALLSAIPSSESCMWVDASFPPSSSSGRSLPSGLVTSRQNVMELNQPAADHVANSFALQFGCSPPSGNCAVYSSTMCAAQLKMHASLHPASMIGSSFPGCIASPWPSSVNFSSGNDGVSASPPHISNAIKASSSRFEFMESFVNTLLPQLKRIHSQSSSYISTQEKFSAVRVAADMSLAISAGGNNIWSQALLQKLCHPYSNKVGVNKTNRTNPTSRRGKIYASILRRNNGSHALRMHNCARASSSKGANLQAFNSTSRSPYQARLGSAARLSHGSFSGGAISESLSKASSHVMRCRKSFYTGKLRCATSKRHCGLVSYVKVLRKTRAVAKSRRVKATAESGNKEASEAQIVPSISKEQIVILGGLVPGGRSMDVPLLFEEAASYILSLQMQVEALQTLSHSVLL